MVGLVLNVLLMFAVVGAASRWATNKQRTRQPETAHASPSPDPDKERLHARDHQQRP